MEDSLDQNYWKKYNENLMNLSNEISLHNKNNIFNYLENNHYNHIRDIVALSIVNKHNIDEKTRILDYGSNFITWSNMSNKIDLRKINLTIFDPFSSEDYSKNLNNDFKFKIVNKLDPLETSKFDLTIFGSSSQYIEKFCEKVLNKKYILGERILFTHTPFSLEKEYISNQYSGFKGKQIIRSFFELEKLFFKKGYSIIFKSILPSDSAKVDKKLSNKIYYANILFEKTKEN